MGRQIRRITNPIVRAFKKVVSFVGDFFGFNIKPMGAPDVGGAEQEQGVLLNKSGTNEQIPVIYGYRRVGGTVIFVETNGTNNSYLYVCYVVCEGEIAGIKKILIDDEALPQPAAGTYAVGTIIDVTEGKYAGRCQLQVFSGTENQSQSSLLNQTPSWPTKSRTLPGVAYVAMRFEWRTITTQAEADANPYQGGVPTVQFDVCGKKVFDVTTHTTGAQLSNTYANLTKTYTGVEGTNPANCLLDYMMNTRYGCGISRDEIDADSFKIAANKYNQSVTYYKEGLTLYPGAAMTCCAVIDTRQKLIDNVKVLVGGCRGMMPYVQGRYKLIVEDGGNATDITSATINIAYDVDKSEIVGGITLTGETKGTKYNQVIVNYVDPNIDFTVQQAVYRVSGDLTVDQDEELTGEFTFGTISSPYIAKFMAESIYKKSRNQSGIELTATQELMDVIPGDIIRITDTVLNLSNKTFRVVNMKLNVDGTISMSCTEHVATNYPYVPGPQIDIPPPIYLPENPPPPRGDPIIVPPPPDQPPPPPPPPPIRYIQGWVTRTVGDPGGLFEQTALNPTFRRKSPSSDWLSQYSQGTFTFVKNGDGTAAGYPFYGARTTSLQFRQPISTLVNRLTIQVFKGNTLLVLKSLPYAYFPQGNPIQEPIVLAKGYRYKIRYMGDTEFRIGGDLGLAPINFPGYTYSIAGSPPITDYSIEGYINFIVDTNPNVPATGGSQSLGG
jgi:hypothetical protein